MDGIREVLTTWMPVTSLHHIIIEYAEEFRNELVFGIVAQFFTAFENQLITITENKYQVRTLTDPNTVTYECDISPPFYRVAAMLGNDVLHIDGKETLYCKNMRTLTEELICRDVDFVEKINEHCVWIKTELHIYAWCFGKLHLITGCIEQENFGHGLLSQEIGNATKTWYCHVDGTIDSFGYHLFNSDCGRNYIIVNQLDGHILIINKHTKKEYVIAFECPVFCAFETFNSILCQLDNGFMYKLVLRKDRWLRILHRVKNNNLIQFIAQMIDGNIIGLQKFSIALYTPDGQWYKNVDPILHGWQYNLYGKYWVVKKADYVMIFR